MSLRDIDFTRDALFAGDDNPAVLREVEAAYRRRTEGQPLADMGRSLTDLLTSLVVSDSAESDPISDVDFQSAKVYSDLFQHIHPLIEKYDPYSLYMVNYYQVCDRCGSSLNWFTDTMNSGSLCGQCSREEFIYASTRPLSEL